MTPSEQTKVAQMQCAYEQEIRELKAKLKACYKVIDNEIPKLEAQLAASVTFEVLRAVCYMRIDNRCEDVCSDCQIVRETIRETGE